MKSLIDALAWREREHPALFEAPHEAAFRLFHGFVEGDPSLVIELFARCVVVHDHSASPEGDGAKVRAAVELLFARCPWLTTAVWKRRRAEEPAHRNGYLLRGERGALPAFVREHGVAYAVDLLMNRDASLYLDTANLRAWLARECANKSVLNAFAYTGSLGIAAQSAAGARVWQLDRSAKFLAIARESARHNGWPEPAKRALLADDFFRAVGRMKAQQSLFDVLVIDPPFFSQSESGTVDLESDPLRLLDKAQPLVAHEGSIVLVNNALFVSGAQWMEAIEARVNKGYLAVRERVEIDELSTGRAPAGTDETDLRWPADPAPWNFPTKIVVLSVRRKDERRANVR